MVKIPSERDKHAIPINSGSSSLDTMCLTVLVPTANRPSLLSSTLQSIANQTAKKSIKRVIVSENGGCQVSREVVEYFRSDLPIEWIYQEISLTPQQHGIWLAKQAKTPFIAQIADDDMWDKYHLEESLLQLGKHKDAIAYFGKTVIVTDNSCWPRGVFAPPFGSLENPDRSQAPLAEVEIWSPVETALNSLGSTPLNIWSVVAKSSAHLHALEESAGHPTLGKYPSNDALYIWRLSMQGHLIVGRHISLFYRTHPGSDIVTSMKYRPLQTIKEDLLIRNEICKQALLLGIDAIENWRTAYKALSSVGRKNIPVISSHHRKWLVGNVNRWNREDIIDKLINLARLVVPPFILMALGKSKKLFT